MAKTASKVKLNFTRIVTHRNFGVLLIDQSGRGLRSIGGAVRGTCGIRISCIISGTGSIDTAGVSDIIRGYGNQSLDVLIGGIKVKRKKIGPLRLLDTSAVRRTVAIGYACPALLARTLLPRVGNGSQNHQLVVGVSSLTTILVGPFSSICTTAGNFGQRFSLTLATRLY